MRSSVWRWLLVASLLPAGSCTLEQVDLTGKACPCADGWVCEEASNRCVEGSATGGSGGSATGGSGGSATGGSGGSGGSTSGGSGGTPSGGAGGTPSGGSGGTPSGGAGGTPSGGSGGTTGGTGGSATGGTGGSATGGSGGSATGGTGGSATGGSGGSATGGSGGAQTGAVRCGTTKCELATQVCCHHEMGSTDQGNCVAKVGGSCIDIRMFCDDANDCGGGANVCCAELDPGGQLKADVQCKSSAAGCTTSGNGSVELLCDPASTAACPSNLSCKPALKMAGYSSCQP